MICNSFPAFFSAVLLLLFGWFEICVLLHSDIVKKWKSHSLCKAFYNKLLYDCCSCQYCYFATIIYNWCFAIVQQTWRAVINSKNRIKQQKKTTKTKVTEKLFRRLLMTPNRRKKKRQPGRREMKSWRAIGRKGNRGGKREAERWEARGQNRSREEKNRDEERRRCKREKKKVK